MDDMKLTKHLLVGDSCKHCIYATTLEKPAAVSCALEYFPGRKDFYTGCNLCASYVSDAIKNNENFMHATFLHKLITFNDLAHFVEKVEQYKDER